MQTLENVEGQCEAGSRIVRGDDRRRLRCGHLYCEWGLHRRRAQIRRWQTIELIDRDGFLALVRQFQRDLQKHYGYEPVTASANEHNSQAAIRNSQLAKPTCPVCQNLMKLRTAKKGGNSGAQFWGCSRFPPVVALEIAKLPALKLFSAWTANDQPPVRRWRNEHRVRKLWIAISLFAF